MAVEKQVVKNIEEYRVSNRAATARISTLGAQIMEYVPAGEKPVLWMSKESWYEEGKAIRGGVPVCFPWFGKVRMPQHGYVRCSIWKLFRVEEISEDLTVVTMKLTEKEVREEWRTFDFDLYMRYEIGRELKMTMTALNRSAEDQKVQMALHTYFNVSDITQIAVTGLKGESELDTLTGETAPCAGDITFNKETDLIYLHSEKSAKIVDRGFNRTISISKMGAYSTVVWNPWIEKSKAMPDFGDEEYHTMVCVECANCRADERVLNAGEAYSMTQYIRIER